MVIILIVASTSFYLGQVLGIPAPNIGATVEPGMQWKCTYTFYQDGSSYLAWKGSGGGNPFAGTDFVTVFQSVLSVAPSGADLCLTTGTYAATGSMFNVAPNNMMLEGEGDGSIIQLAAGTARPLINIGPVINFTIANIIFDGNKANQVDPATRGAGELLILTNIANKHITFFNSVCKNARSGACLDIDGSDITVTASGFLHNGAGSFTSDHVHIGRADSVKATANFFNDCTDTGLALDTVINAEVSGNTFIDCGGQLLTEAIQSRDITVIGNHFEQTFNSSPFINIDIFSGANPAANDTTITGNVFYNLQATTYNAITMESFYRATLAENIFYLKGSSINRYAINIFNLRGGTGLTIVNNQFNLVTGGIKGILVENTTDFTISGNYFKTSNIAIEFAGVSSANGVLNGNNFQGIVTPLLFTTSPTTITVTNNLGYNPQAVGSHTAGTSPFTVPTVFYPQQIQITTLNGQTGWTCEGQTMINAVAQLSPTLPPGLTCILTWTTTAPVYETLPQ